MSPRISQNGGLAISPRSRFNRFSLGIQDFDDEVLHAVNRHPSLLPVADIIEVLRKGGARVNFDFIYGLPQQTVEKFVATIEAAIALRPDRLVTFSYAHLPTLFKRQTLLEKAGLPPQDEKLKMFECAAQRLEAAGYRPIGMDHFVLPDDELFQPCNTTRCTAIFKATARAASPRKFMLLACRASVSWMGLMRKHERHCRLHRHCGRGENAHCQRYALAPWQRIAREVIECMMCNHTVDWRELAAHLQCSVADIQQAIVYDEAQLSTMQEDGLLVFDAHSVRCTP